jgi:hypothetical protein
MPKRLGNQLGGVLPPSGGSFDIDGRDLVIRDRQKNIIFRFGSQTGNIFVRDKEGNVLFTWNARTNDLRLGGTADGSILVFNKDANNIQSTSPTKAVFHLEGKRGIFWCGGGETSGKIIFRNPKLQSASVQTIMIDGENRVIQMTNGGNRIPVDINGDGVIRLGAKSNSGRIELYPRTVSDNTNLNNTSILLDANSGNVDCKILKVSRSANIQGLTCDDNARFRKELTCEGNARFHKELTCDHNATFKKNITCHGDVILANGDCAEDFEVEQGAMLEPGSVVVLNEQGKLQLSSSPYDKKVAGIIAGAGSTKPAIILGRVKEEKNKLPVALIGKVFCKVDATQSSVEVGDMLTTSSLMGHAMKATDPFKSFGAIIGKALAPISGKKGLIPVLVSLQ